MPRHSFPALLQTCIVLAALTGCAGGDESNDEAADESAIADATVAPPTGAPPTGTPPSAQPAFVAVLEDIPYHSVLSATDADGDALTFSIADPPAHATVTLDPASGAFMLRPHENFYGADAFEFAVADGHGNLARARVSVTVEPVNDAPVIDTATTATVVAAGSPMQLDVGISDPDGDRITLSVSQAGGSLPLSNLEWDPQGVRFTSPDVHSATTVELLLHASDETGLSASKQLFVTVSPVSPSGKLFTVSGSPDSNGLHWVITGDGFTAGQQQDLLQAALAMARHLVGAPELARHAAVWNVHVLTAVSHNSGISDQGVPRGSRTAFDASLHCTDVDRVACVNWDKVYAALLGEQVAFDEVAVILNSNVYVGNTSSSGLVVSRHRDAAAVVLHEMGHLVAGLADEYVDANVARGFLGRYEEGRFPNVTTATDPALIPWRHWFADTAHIPVDPGEAGVGRFEGAYYMPSGFYRPKRDSFMRTLGAPIGEVNAEAWLRALYRAVPPLFAASPAPRFVTGRAGEALTFEIVSLWPAEIMAVHWSVDGVEIETARDAWRYVVQADGRDHEVRASIADRTGMVRAPQAREHMGSVTWTVSGDGHPTVAAKALPPVQRIGGWIRMRIDAAGHAVLGISKTEARSLHHFGAAPDAGFEYALFDAAGTLLSERRMADPRVVRAPLAPAGTPAAGHGMALLESGYYLIEIPEGTDARRLRIRALDGSAEKATAESMADALPSIEQWLDL